MLKLQPSMTVPANSLILEIAPETIAIAETLIETQSSVAAAWTAHDHYLAMETLCVWLQDNTQDAVQPWLSDGECAAVWDVMPGAVLDWGGVRLALFATESVQEEVLTVPQEWVELPGDFAVDYYLAVELHLERPEDDSWLEVYGYATRSMIQEHGTYQPEERCYVVPQSALVTDLNVLLLSQRLFGQRSEAIAPLPALDAAMRQQIFRVAVAWNPAQADVSNPRTLFPFEEWGAFFGDAEARSQLYAARMAATTAALPEPTPVMPAQPEPVRPVAVVLEPEHPPSIQLRQWFQELGTAIKDTAQDAAHQGWRSMESVMASFESSSATLSYATRDSTMVFPSAVSEIVELLNTYADKETQHSAIQLLGKIGRGNQTAIQALMRFKQKTMDVDLRRWAAVNLGKIDPKNREAGVRRGKVIDFRMRVNQAPLILILTLLPERGKTNLQVRVKGVNQQDVLPENLQLVILDGEKNILRQERSRSHDQAVQIAFRASTGDEFGVRVALDEHQITEFFTV